MEGIYIDFVPLRFYFLSNFRVAYRSQYLFFPFLKHAFPIHCAKVNFPFVPEGAHQRIKYCILGILLKNNTAVISLLALKHSVDGALTFGSVDEIPTFFYTNERYKAITIVLKQ